jgi:fructosamine-3-kinase
MHQLLTSIANILGEEIFRHTSMSGGDISQAYLLETRQRKVFLKLNTSADGMAMFTAEKDGLLAIAATKTIQTPEVFHCGTAENTAVLLLEYIETKRPDEKDLELLGQQVAHLHQTTAETFGWDTDNFIGRLPQYNHRNKAWPTFYLTQRFLPQFKMAHDKGLLSPDEIPDEHVMSKALENLLPPVRPALLHGDLWGGNYVISSEGMPYLIDPAVYYGHSEVDLAMSRLFGGFGSRFYSAYAEIIPATSGSEERNDLYQLYYLLVHLNMFGRSYYGQVMEVVRRVFKV